MRVRRMWRSPWLPFGCWILVILILSSVPDLGPPDVGVPWMDKICHLGEYGILGFLFARAARREARFWPMVVAGALLGLLLGGLDENYQRLTPGRDVSRMDVLADIFGATLGALAWWCALLLWRRHVSGREPTRE